MCSVLDTVDIFGEDMCFSVVFDPLVGVLVFSVVLVADDICNSLSV